MDRGWKAENLILGRARLSNAFRIMTWFTEYFQSALHIRMQLVLFPYYIANIIIPNILTSSPVRIKIYSHTSQYMDLRTASLPMSKVVTCRVHRTDILSHITFPLRNLPGVPLQPELCAEACHGSRSQESRTNNEKPREAKSLRRRAVGLSLNVYFPMSARNLVPPTWVCLASQLPLFSMTTVLHTARAHSLSLRHLLGKSCEAHHTRLRRRVPGIRRVALTC